MSTGGVGKRIWRVSRCWFGVGAKGQEPGGPLEAASENMKRVKKDFSRTHAMAIHLNAIAMIMTVWYGFSFASRLNPT